jgi:site-specific DNA recombinase
MQMIRKRAAICVRVSTAGQGEDGTSLKTQEAACRRCAAEHGYCVDEAHIYREIFSGALLHERPGLSTLRAAARAGGFDVVICYAVDRLSRNQVHIAILLDDLQTAGVGLEFVTESFEDSPVGKFILNARTFVAEMEREKIRLPLEVRLGAAR